MTEDIYIMMEVIKLQFYCTCVRGSFVSGSFTERNNLVQRFPQTHRALSSDRDTNTG